MIKLIINNDLSDEELISKNKIWTQESNVCLELEPGNKSENYNQLCFRLLKNKNLEIAIDALADLAEVENISNQVLLQLIELKNTDIFVSLSLRKAMPKVVWEACLRCEDKDVRERIQIRIKNNDFPVLGE